MKKIPIPIKVGSYSWPSKELATDFYVDLLNRYSPGDKIESGSDFGAIYALIYMRENPLDKIGSGIDYFYITNNPWRPYINELRVKRTDGTEDDLSIHKTISAYHKFYNPNNYYKDVPFDRKPGTKGKLKDEDFIE